jgi:hypothetical protein
MFGHVRDKSGPAQRSLMLHTCRHASEEPTRSRRPGVPHGASQHRVDRAVIRLVPNRHKVELPSLVHAGDPKQCRGVNDTIRSCYPHPNRAWQEPGSLPYGRMEEPNRSTLRHCEVISISVTPAQRGNVAERRQPNLKIAPKEIIGEKIIDTFFTPLPSLAHGQEMKMCPQRRGRFN